MPNRLFMTVGACALLFSSMLVFGQAAQSGAPAASASSRSISDDEIQIMRSDIREHRKKLTAANMTLTPDEATKFWPIYDQYIKETIAINDTRWSLIKEYAANYDKMTDKFAEDYIKKSAGVDQQLVALREKYIPIFEKVVSPKKTAQWYQIDRRLDLMINLQLWAMIPLVDASK